MSGGWLAPEAPVREHRPVPARLPLLAWGLAAVAIAASVVELAIDAGLLRDVEA